MDERAYRTVPRETGVRRTCWLRPLLGTTTRDASQAYMIALQHVAATLDADPAWQSWWRRSGAAECELGMVAEGRLDHLRPSADIRKIDNKVRASFTCTLPASAGSLPADLLDLAVVELTGMFEVIQEAIGLPCPPAVPRLPDLPAEVHTVEVTTKALPSMPREVEEQGYLTLAQIQEFFG